MNIIDREKRRPVFNPTLAIALFGSLISLIFSLPSISSAEDIEVIFSVVYTPEARDDEGGDAAMLARVIKAFEDANEIFSNSATGVRLVVGYVQGLSANEDAHDSFPPNSCPECPALSKQHKPDADMTIVKTGIAWAKIPLNPRQALEGGSLWFGRRNVGGKVLAHEAGHMLGLNHGTTEVNSQGQTLSMPTGGYGNVFKGQSGKIFHTIMSYGLEGQASTLCPLFSSPSLYHDGVPTGNSGADAVTAIKYWVQYVSIAGEQAFPDPIKLYATKDGFKTTLGGTCLDDVGGNASDGDSIEIFQKDEAGTVTSLGTAICDASGRFSLDISQLLTGTFQALHHGINKYSEWIAPLWKNLSIRGVRTSTRTTFSGVCYEKDGITPSTGTAIEIWHVIDANTEKIAETICSAEGTYNKQIFKSIVGEVGAYTSDVGYSEFVKVKKAAADDDNSSSCSKRTLRKLRKKLKRFKRRGLKKRVKKVRRKIRACRNAS